MLIHIDKSCNASAVAAATLHWFLVFLLPAMSQAQPSPSGLQISEREKVIIDTDIGTDIDDAFAIALALRSPELDILGFSTTTGDTAARAKILDRMLGESGHENIPVAAGDATSSSPGGSLRTAPVGPQKLYGEQERYARTSHRAAVDLILQQIHRFPGQVTLVTIGPLSNVGALIDRDIGSFRKLKRVVMMGGWIGSVDAGVGQTRGPAPEYNIMADIHAAQKLFNSGVPIYVMPIDSTIHLTLDEARRKTVFSEGTPITDALALLYPLWGGTTPVLFDAMAVTFTVDPQLCPVEPMHILVDENGITRVGEGPSNAHVCLHSDANDVLDHYMQRITNIRKSTE